MEQLRKISVFPVTVGIQCGQPCVWSRRPVVCEKVVSCAPGYHCEPRLYLPAPVCWLPFCFYPETPTPKPVCVKTKETCRPSTTAVPCDTLLECSSGHHCEPENITLSFCCDGKRDCVCNTKVNATEKMRCVPNRMCSMSPPGAPIACSTVMSCDPGYHCEPALIPSRPTCLKEPGCRCPPPGPDGPAPKCVEDPLCAMSPPGHPVPCSELISCDRGEHCEPAMIASRPSCIKKPGCRCPPPGPRGPTPRCVRDPLCAMSPPGHPVPCSELISCDRGEHCEPAMITSRPSCIKKPGCRCPPPGPRGPTPRCVRDPLCAMSRPGYPVPCSELISCDRGEHCEPAMITSRPSCIKRPGCRCPPPGPQGPIPECVEDPLCDMSPPGHPVSCAVRVRCPPGQHCEPRMLLGRRSCIRKPGCRCPPPGPAGPSPRCVDN
ncbi:basic proline-rich protein-like [Lingula anatina]|uniref:Basic proline-rich protein-like n=1 Tax=Lingula anatina TaxID=7574 RepID=A0A1S3J5W8_LINAN|nr:basic proline-rich protein-like [Lingula anatina]|eukprot:XP_013405234.1 basic proline-rich protein-like [Lingula anatina]